jgi:hypothetical protein
VLRFRPICWEHDVQRLEITAGELLPDQEIPLLKSRRELSRAEALKLWGEKRKAGWAPLAPSGELVLFAVEAPTAVIGLPY